MATIGSLLSFRCLVKQQRNVISLDFVVNTVNCLSFSNSEERAKKLLKMQSTDTSGFVMSNTADLLQQTCQAEVIKLVLQLKSLSRQVPCPKYPCHLKIYSVERAVLHKTENLTPFYYLRRESSLPSLLFAQGFSSNAAMLF